MIRPIDIRLNAAHPELPLAEAVTFTGAPSTVLIRGVPPNCGRWAITAVFVAATFPDGSTTTRAAVQSANGVWVATLPATARSGRTANGIRVMADGIDENGEAVTGYILGVADFAVASLGVTPAPEPGETNWQMLYFDAVPSTLRKGDVTKIDGVLKFYNGEEWVPFTDLSDYYTAEQVDEAIDKLAAYYITADAQGNPFATHAALVDAQTYYSGGAVRTPTRNDYAVVSADETHGGAEWRYIYAVDAQGAGQWEPQYAVEGVIAYDNTVTRTSANGVKSSGIWSAIWGALSALPSGFSSLYDWCASQLGLKRDLTDMACTVDVAGIPQIGSGKFVVTSPSGTSTTLTPFDSYGVIGWGWYRTYPYIYARASNSYDIIFGLGISDMIPLDMTAKTQTVTYNGETWTIDAYTGATVNTRIANMTDVPAASTSTPATDSGSGSAGTSAAFARGDHVHPTDTSRMAASATGADILSGRSGVPPTETIVEAFSSVGYDRGAIGNALSEHTSDTTIHVTAAEKSTWNGKQNALSAQQLANIAAVPDKLDKSGGDMTGPLTIIRGDDNIKIDGSTIRFNDNEGHADGGTITGTPNGGNVVLPQSDGTLALTAGSGHEGNLAALDASGNPTDAGYHFEVRNGIPCIIQYT